MNARTTFNTPTPNFEAFSPVAVFNEVYKLLKIFHDLLTKKSLEHGGSWGGKECAEHLPLSIHILESSFMIWAAMIVYIVFGIAGRFEDLYNVVQLNLTSAKHRDSLTARWIDTVLAAIHFGMYAQLIYYKWNCSSLINLVQPCHLILLFEGIALAFGGAEGTVITALILPSLSGTFLAILFPDTSGLDQPFEAESYWIQHFLIIVVPVYLLVRRNGLAVEVSTAATIGIGLWILWISHFTFFEVRMRFSLL
jgi:TMEM164 family